MPELTSQAFWCKLTVIGRAKRLEARRTRAGVVHRGKGDEDPPVRIGIYPEDYVILCLFGPSITKT